MAIIDRIKEILEQKLVDLRAVWDELYPLWNSYHEFIDFDDEYPLRYKKLEREYIPIVKKLHSLGFDFSQLNGKNMRTALWPGHHIIAEFAIAHGATPDFADIIEADNVMMVSHLAKNKYFDRFMDPDPDDLKNMMPVMEFARMFDEAPKISNWLFMHNIFEPQWFYMLHIGEDNMEGSYEFAKLTALYMGVTLPIEFAADLFMMCVVSTYFDIANFLNENYKLPKSEEMFSDLCKHIIFEMSSLKYLTSIRYPLPRNTSIAIKRSNKISELLDFRDKLLRDYEISLEIKKGKQINYLQSGHL
jgi:hypothetical protein